MEYQFSYDLIGNHVAKCELDCELFGDWLSQDIGKDKKQVIDLLDKIQRLHNYQIQEYRHVGKTFHLLLEHDEAELTLNNLDLDDTVNTEETDWQVDQVSGCGLVDLEHLLEAWVDFITY